MNYNNSLQTSQWVMFFLQTISAIDLPGNGPRKLPAPKAYVAIIAVWSGLDILADTGRARAASIVGWVLVLTSLVVGPNGTVAVAFLRDIAKLYPITNSSKASGPTAGTGTSSGPNFNHALGA